jgi:hypothetical protein
MAWSKRMAMPLQQADNLESRASLLDRSLDSVDNQGRAALIDRDPGYAGWQGRAELRDDRAQGKPFARDVILWGVRWYVAHPISYRQLEEMMEEHGVEVNHSTLNRWVVQFTCPSWIVGSVRSGTNIFDRTPVINSKPALAPR